MIRVLCHSLMAMFLILALLSAGCTSLRTADTHNITVAVQSFNTWAAGQKEFDTELRGSAGIIGGHITTYNAEIAKEQPDYSLIRENLAQDRQILDRWGSRIDELSAATTRFETETSPLTYSNETVQETKAHLAIMAQYMKIYAINVGMHASTLSST